MMGRRGVLALCALALGGAALTSGRTEAAFNASPGNAANSYSAAPDFVAPVVVRTRVADPANPPSYGVRQCRFYYAYAEVADSGNPASGVASVTTDLSALTAGAGAASLLAGAYSLEGESYGWRGPAHLATAAPGSYAYDLASTDGAANSRVEAGFPAAVWAGSGGVAAVFLTGFEHGVASADTPGVLTSVTGAGVSADGVTRRHGAYSLRVAPAGAAAYATATLGGPADTAVVRFAVRLAALPAATVDLFAVMPDGGSTAYLAYDAASGRLGVRWGAGSIVPGSVGPAVGAWHVVEMRASFADPHILEWRLDGIEQASASSAEAARTVSRIGFGTNAANVTYTAHFDDVIVSLTPAAYPIGNGRVLSLALDGAGRHSQPSRFRNDDGSQIDATTWTRLEEIPGNSAADYVKQTNAASNRYLEFTFADIDEACINAVGALLAYHSAGAAANDGRAIIVNGTSEATVYAGDMGGTALRHARVVVSPGGGGWTAALVNALVARVGYSADVNPNPYWDALLLEYDVPLSW